MNYSFYVGCYTKEPKDKGIHLLNFDTERGELKHIDSFFGERSPSFLTRTGNFLYAANEVGGAGMLSALSVKADKTLVYLNSAKASGMGTCHAAEMNGFLYGANYSSGSVFGAEILTDGSLGKIVADIQHEGSGPNEKRQKQPHAHSVNPVAGKDIIIAADLGADKLFCYRQQKDGSLKLSTAVAAPAGGGPRHMAFSPDGKRVYAVMEMGITVVCYKMTDTGPVFEAEYPLVPEIAPNDSSADIHFAANGTRLYVTTRGTNINTAFNVGSNGKLELIGRYSTHGDSPRNFCLSPCEKYVVTANQASGHITICPVGEDGAIGEMIGSVVLSGPSCVINA